MRWAEVVQRCRMSCSEPLFSKKKGLANRSRAAALPASGERDEREPHPPFRVAVLPHPFNGLARRSFRSPAFISGDGVSYIKLYLIITVYIR